MNQYSTFKRLLLAMVLVLSFSFTAVAFAQETGGQEGQGAGEAEAQEVGGEESGQVESSTEEEATAEEGAENTEAAAVSPLTPLGINAGFLLAQIVNFGLIFIALRVFLWKPLMNMLDSRAVTIQKGVEDAAAAANARRNAETEAERILTAARADASHVVEEARVRGEEVARQIEVEARQGADAIRTEGHRHANEERDRQLADLRGQVAAISIAVAQRLIGESLDAQRQQTLINDFFSKVPADAKSLGGSVEVISAMPLTPEEQTRVKNELSAQDATFTVDPSILGGLVVRGSQRVVDGSVRSSLNEVAGLLR